MIQIDDKILSLDILQKHFCCDLAKCHGSCCVQGQSGAPLTQDEVLILEDIIKKITPFLKPEGIKSIKEQGVATIDGDGDVVTPLIDGKECAYCIEENGVSLCAIEKAWLNKKIDFRKPISCHLYPIRVKSYTSFIGLNYDQWDVCEPARKLGIKQNIPVYKCLKDAITRAYGKEFYQQIEDAARLLENEGDE
ncbi:MAG: DUF3109 family protein [Bacteroidales bacterium]|nr:MAG: DUF3109 family protein [Bacteroidales bacterium]